MVLMGPTFTCIKLTLLYFYRRIFLVNQRWLRVAWWVNIVYVGLWCVGSTGFYLFQCWPVQWYYMQCESLTLKVENALTGICRLCKVPRTASVPNLWAVQRYVGSSCVYSLDLRTCFGCGYLDPAHRGYPEAELIREGETWSWCCLLHWSYVSFSWLLGLPLCG